MLNVIYTLECPSGLPFARTAEERVGRSLWLERWHVVQLFACDGSVSAPSASKVLNKGQDCGYWEYGSKVVVLPNAQVLRLQKEAPFREERNSLNEIQKMSQSSFSTQKER